MKHSFRLTNAAQVCAGLALISTVQVVHASDAEVIMVQGKVEVRDQTTGVWRIAAAQQPLKAGDSVRTGESSQMALLVKDKTQVRLNQLSSFQIKQAGDANGGTSLELTGGRMWAQAKQFTVGLLRATTSLISQQRKLVVTTPTATIGIRGTDWEVNVGDDGATVVSVFSGEVAVANDLGEVSVGPSEQATVRNGVPPQKTVLTNARDRVQWVSAVRLDVDRYPDFAQSPSAAPVRDMLQAQKIQDARKHTEAMLTANTGTAAAPAGAWLLASDFALLSGDIPLSRSRLDEGQKRFPNDDRFPAYQARAALLSGDTALARQTVESARKRFPESVELGLVDGELGRLDGNGAVAVARFGSATEKAPADFRAWQGLGVTLAEQEDFDPARAALTKAIGLVPQFASPLADLGALETRAQRLSQAQVAIDQSLVLAPDDYVAWTSRGILLLAQGKPEAALEALLKAGLLEPRYARAQLYTAIAWYQIGRDDAALAALERTKKADPNDPLPYFYEAQIHRDGLNPTAAIAAAREAMARFQFLKSLGPIATDRQGNANLGAAYALFGLESWAKRIAQDSQHPFFAGSYLFMAERSTEAFVKNSSLIQGYLTDPTLFGASPQRSKLIGSPGGYAALDASYRQSDAFSVTTASLIANGYASSPMPIAGFIQYEAPQFRSGNVEFNATAPSLITALGFRPDAKLGVFLYRDQFKPTFDNVPVFTDGDRVIGTVVRTDIGAQWQLDPRTAVWARTGQGQDDTAVTSNVAAQSTAYRAETKDAGLRLTAMRDSGEWTLGLETGRSYKPLVNTGTGRRLELARATDATGEGDGAFGSWKKRFDTLLVQTDLNLARYRFDQTETIKTTTIATGLSSTQSLPQISREVDANTVNFGLAWSPTASGTYRLAWQDLMRPAASLSLASQNTAGISLDVPGLQAGGRLKRLRLQGEWELSASNFLMAFADHRDIRNLFNTDGTLLNASASLAQYDRLRQQSGGQGESAEALESSPSFAAGTVKTAGLTFESMASSHVSWTASYVHAQTENELYPKVPLPQFPKHTVRFGLNWFAPERWVLRSALTGRTERTTDAQGSNWLDPDWDLSLSATWQDAAKRRSFEIFAARLARKDESAAVGIRGNWRY
jgi:tetratricopeptide (TPR) repeat protein